MGAGHEQLKAEFEVKYEEIQEELVERAMAHDPEPIRQQYAEEDAAARVTTEAFEEEAGRRHQKLRREANDYFNKEYGHDFLRDRYAGMLVDVNIP